MSRIGKLPIKISKDINVVISGNVIKISKGNITKEYNFGDKIRVVFEDGEIKVVKIDKDDDVGNYLGLHRSNINNIVHGLTEGFKKVLEINGVGYRSAVTGNLLILGLGYSHDIAYAIPEGIKITPDKPNLLIIEGDDKQLVGQVASEIISFRKPEPYLGKGVKEYGKAILRKEGKKK